AFAGWNDSPVLHPELGGNPERSPVIIVATEGGGMRAAYWTAVLLSKLQQASPNFRDRLFAISGVSAGAGGATVFARLRRLDPTATACRETTPDQTLMTCSRQILAHDTLDPAIGAFLYPDLVQWFLPIPFLPDRAAALEKGWESAWDDSVASDP